MEFPFVPKSASELEPGVYWAFPLSDGRFGAAVVLSRVVSAGKPNRQLFITGVLDWAGSAPPSADDLCSASIVESGMAHIRTIKYNAGEALGRLERELNAPAEVAFDALSTFPLPSWGLEYARHVAEKRAGNHRWVQERLQSAFGAKG